MVVILYLAGSFPKSCLILCNPMDYSYPWQEYWSGLLFPPTGDLSDPDLKPRWPLSTLNALMLFILLVGSTPAKCVMLLRDSIFNLTYYELIFMVVATLLENTVLDGTSELVK